MGKSKPDDLKTFLKIPVRIHSLSLFIAMPSSGQQICPT